MGKNTDPFEGLTPEERKIVEEMIESMPEDVQEKIRKGEGKVIVAKDGVRSGHGNPYQVGFGLVMSAINDDMNEAVMRGEDPTETAMRQGAAQIGAHIFHLAKAFPLQVDVIFKSMIVGVAAWMDKTPKELLEEMVEHAPDTKTLHVGEIHIDRGNDEDNKDEINRLNELFNLPTTDEPTTKDDPKEEK